MSAILTNREISITVWLLIIVFIALLYKPFRTQIPSLLHSFFQWKIVLSFLLSVLYASLIVFLLYRFELWDLTLLFDTVLWFFSSIGMFFYMHEIASDKSYLRKAIIKTITIIALLTFVVNYYSFSLFAEFFLVVPCTTIVGILSGVASTRKDWKPAENLFNTLAALIMLVLLVHTILGVMFDSNNLFSWQTPREILFPTIATILYIPFIYLTSLISEYETIFVRLNGWFRKDPKDRRFIKWSLMRYCNLNIWRLHKCSGKFFLDLSNTQDKSGIISTIKSWTLSS